MASNLCKFLKWGIPSETPRRSKLVCCMRVPAGSLFTMTEIKLDHLISVLEEVPRENWWEEKSFRVHKLHTEIDCTKIHQPPYRDIPGYYKIVLERYKSEELIIYSLDVYKNEEIIFYRESCAGQRPGIEQLYHKINPEPHASLRFS